MVDKRIKMILYVNLVALPAYFTVIAIKGNLIIGVMLLFVLAIVNNIFNIFFNNLFYLLEHRKNYNIVIGLGLLSLLLSKVLAEYETILALGYLLVWYIISFSIIKEFDTKNKKGRDE